jgi:urease accessory protein
MEASAQNCESGFDPVCGSPQLAWLPALMQCADPLFPTGGYAHSMGLEQWAKQQSYRSAEDLSAFLLQQAGPALVRMELPYLRLARQALESADWENLVVIEQQLDASKWSAELRAASMAQGRGRLRLLRKLYPNCQQMDAYHARQQQRQVFGHHSVVTALQSILLEMPLAACLLAYAYQSLANYASAAIKLLRLSPESVQSALTQAIAVIPEWVEASMQVERDAVGWLAPAFDISSAQHATAFSRLFIS